MSDKNMNKKEKCNCSNPWKCSHSPSPKLDWMEEFVEEGARLEHSRWAGWQRYLHSKCLEMNFEGKKYVYFPVELYDRWEKQIETSYFELSEEEKESDRKEVRKYLPLIQSLLIRQREKLLSESDYSHGYADAQIKVRQEQIITIGYHKGEMDFGINGSICELTLKQMDELRIMTIVAIGQAEQMWRNKKQLPSYEADEVKKTYEKK